MNRQVRAFQPILIMLLILTASLALSALFILTGNGGQIIPPPEGVATQFVIAMGARRETGALNQLSGELQQQVTADQLREIIHSIQKAHGGIDFARADQASEQGDQATARVKVRLNDLQERTLEFPLAKEKGQWKLTSLDPIRQLAQ